MSGSNIENEMKSQVPISKMTLESQVPILKMKWSPRSRYWRWNEVPGSIIENEPNSQVPILKMKWGPRSQYWKWNEVSGPNVENEMWGPRTQYWNWGPKLLLPDTAWIVYKLEHKEGLEI